jgi:hypothetical protein
MTGIPANPVKAAIGAVQAKAKGKLVSSKTEHKKVPQRDGLAKFAQGLAKTMR